MKKYAPQMATPPQPRPSIAWKVLFTVGFLAILAIVVFFLIPALITANDKVFFSIVGAFILIFVIEHTTDRRR